MTIDDLIDQFIDDLEFDVLIDWADILGVDRDEISWFDDEWPEREIELRDAVADAIKKIGKK